MMDSSRLLALMEELERIGGKLDYPKYLLLQHYGYTVNEINYCQGIFMIVKRKNKWNKI